MPPHILIATYADGLFSLHGQARRHEHPGLPIRGLTPDGAGGLLAIVSGASLQRRSPDGVWTDIVCFGQPLACCLAANGAILAGTEDARILRLSPRATLDRLPGFDAVAGRDTWYAGAAIIDGKRAGPPLGIRSLAATADGALLANVHVGGIPRSADKGQTWRPTIDIAADVHQVCAHPTEPNLVIAAAAVGLCLSRDGGVTWSVEARGLHAPHCSPAAFGRRDIFVSASTDPFAAHGALYRRPIAQTGPLRRVEAGLPYFLDGIIDTGCIAANGAAIAVIDRAGRLYLSQDDGESWTHAFDCPATPSGVMIC